MQVKEELHKHIIISDEKYFADITIVNDKFEKCKFSGIAPNQWSMDDWRFINIVSMYIIDNGGRK